MLSEPQIIWEKWSDPFGFSKDQHILPEYENEYYEDNQQKNQVLITNMGIIPFNEATDCSKIFNFWIGHTNFNISTVIAQLIQDVDGVETLDVFTRYRFRVAFGKAFVDRDVINQINTIINQTLK